MEQGQIPPAPAAVEPERVMEIDTGRNRRWIRWLTWLAIVLLAGAGVVWMFLKLGTTFGMACFLVAFMIVYMAVMGRWTEGNIRGRS
jgi:hypothetical protein